MAQIHIKLDFSDGVLVTVIQVVKNVSALDCPDNTNIYVRGELVPSANDDVWTTEAAAVKDNCAEFEHEEEFNDKVEDIKTQSLRLTVFSGATQIVGRDLGQVLVGLDTLKENVESDHCFDVVKIDFKSSSKSKTDDRRAPAQDRPDDEHPLDEIPESAPLPPEQELKKFKQEPKMTIDPDQEIKKSDENPKQIEPSQKPEHPGQGQIRPGSRSSEAPPINRSCISFTDSMATPLPLIGNMPVLHYLPKDPLLNMFSIYRSDLHLSLVRPKNKVLKKKKKKQPRLDPIVPETVQRCRSEPNLRLPRQPDETRKRRELRFELEKADTFSDIRKELCDDHRERHRNLSVAALHPLKGLYLPGLVFGPPTSQGDRMVQSVTMYNGDTTKIRIDSGKHIIRIGGAMPCPDLRVGDYVLVKQTKEDWSAMKYYNPGVVIRQRLGAAYEHKFYTVLLHSNNKVEATRRCLLKISYRRYKEALNEMRIRTLNRHPVSAYSARPPSSCQSDQGHVLSRDSLSGSRRSSRDSGLARPTRQRNALDPRQEVLARWPDDGWFYYAVVVATTGNNIYKVKDALGNVTTVHRDDVLTDRCYSHKVEVGNFVIGPHPRYRRSFAPAEVIAKHYPDVEILFYDGVTEATTVNHVYKLSTETHETVLDFIRKCEEKYIGGKAVVFDKASKCFSTRVIRNKTELQQLIYPAEDLVEWRRLSELPVNREHRQTTQHIFPLTDIGLLNRRREDWRYALGPLNTAQTVFLPAKVKRPKDRNAENCDVTLEFCNGKSSTQISLHECFYLNRDYYNLASGVCAEYRA